MESGRQFRDSLANTMKHDKRSKLQTKSLFSTRASFFMFFFSCLAWLYVAGRLWQNSENRTVLSQILQKHSIKVPKIFTFEDKIKSLQCKNLEKRIVDSEMDITFAKSQGYLRNQMMQKGTLSGQKFLAVVGVYTGFGSHSSRESFRKSWMPTDDALKKLEERGVILRFVIGRSANRGDSLDRNVDNENHRTKDFLILEGHEEAQEELAKKVKFFFSTAVEMWNAEFYVKLDDNIKLDLDGLITFLENRQGQESAYIGCMKSGDVIVEEGKQWYEPDWWKFGDGKSYFRHASGTLLILSEILARYISINSASLKTYAHDDISIGSWMMGINATYVDDGRLCCRSSKQDKLCSTA